MMKLAMIVSCCALAAGCANGGAPQPPEPSDTAAAHGDGLHTATSADWRGQTVTRTEELFAGRFAGVQVLRVGSGIAVRIRGTTSFMGNNEPLYVVDGMPLEPSPNGLIALNPSDIAKIEILKDIGSTAAYGVRGANGVVLITTKR